MEEQFFNYRKSVFISLHPFQKDEQRFFISEYYNEKYCNVNNDLQ